MIDLDLRKETTSLLMSTTFLQSGGGPFRQGFTELFGTHAHTHVPDIGFALQPLGEGAGGSPFRVCAHATSIISGEEGVW